MVCFYSDNPHTVRPNTRTTPSESCHILSSSAQHQWSEIATDPARVQGDNLRELKAEVLGLSSAEVLDLEIVFAAHVP